MWFSYCNNYTCTCNIIILIFNIYNTTWSKRSLRVLLIKCTWSKFKYRYLYANSYFLLIFKILFFNREIYVCFWFSFSLISTTWTTVTGKKCFTSRKLQVNFFLIYLTLLLKWLEKKPTKIKIGYESDLNQMLI